MAKRGKQAADYQLLLALACGANVEGAARQASVSESTVRRRMKDTGFVHEVQKLRGEMLQRTASQLTAAGTESVRTLVLLQQAPNSGTVRLGAARAVLELGIKIRESADFETRLAMLEAAEAERKAHDARGNGRW